jgi:hypothetical protein
MKISVTNVLHPVNKCNKVLQICYNRYKSVTNFVTAQFIENHKNYEVLDLCYNCYTI